MTSPVIEGAVVEETTMTFPEAMVELISGASIKRKDWRDIDEYGLLKDEKLMIHKDSDKLFHSWTVSYGDLVATDWFIIKKTN